MPKKAVTEKKLVDYGNSVEAFFTKTLPGLPAGAKEFIVKFGPWITLVMMVLALPAVLTVFGVGSIVAPYGYMMGRSWGYGFTLSWVISLISIGLSVWALPGLFKRQMFSWKLMLYSTLVTAVGALLSGSLGSLVIGTGLSLYVLYQIKSYYK